MASEKGVMISSLNYKKDDGSFESIPIGTFAKYIQQEEGKSGAANSLQDKINEIVRLVDQLKQSISISVEPDAEAPEYYVLKITQKEVV